MSGKPRKLLIITADDFGYDVDRNRGIVESFRGGAITRTSLLVNAVACKDACQLAKTFNIPLGLHLNLIEGKPVSKPEEVKSLLTEDGDFLGYLKLTESLKQGKTAQSEVKKEIEAQISRFKVMMDGQLPRYVDGHQHSHIIAGVCETFVEVLAMHGIHHTRLPDEKDLDKYSWIDDSLKSYYSGVSSQMTEARSRFASHGIIFPDGFCGSALMGNCTNAERLQKVILDSFERLSAEKSSSKDPPSGAVLTLELMTHPGYPSHDVEEGGCGVGGDEFSASPDREQEMQILKSEDMKKFYKSADIELSS